MTISKIDHIGIAVTDMDAAIAAYTKLLGAAPVHVEDVPSEKVRTAFFKVGETQVELLAATHPDSPIATFIAKKGEGVHHLAFRVKDIRAAIAQYQKDGFTIIGAAPRPGTHGTQVAFLHPKSTHGMLIELVSLSQ